MWLKLKCPKCGFEYSVIIPDKAKEKDVEEIMRCPCGARMEIVAED